MVDLVIVAMDGSTHVSTAALLTSEAGEWRVLARRTDTDSRGQARVLLRLVDDMLAETGRRPADIAALVVGVGPGTFTGVRIAVATARALALALDIPVIGVSTLASLVAETVTAQAATGHALPGLIVPVVDARRGQVFFGLYGRRGDGAAYERRSDFAVCDRGALLASLPPGQETLIVGDIALLEGEAGDGPGLARLRALEVRAEHLVVGQDRLEEPGGELGGSRLDGWFACVLEDWRPEGGGREPGCGKAGAPGTPEAVKPIYVRSPDADIHITKMRDPWAEA